MPPWTSRWMAPLRLLPTVAASIPCDLRLVSTISRKRLTSVGMFADQTLREPRTGLRRPLRALSVRVRAGSRR